MIIPGDEDPDSDETAISSSFARTMSQESQEGPALTSAQPNPETPPASQVSWSSQLGFRPTLRYGAYTLTHAHMHSRMHSRALTHAHIH